DACPRHRRTHPVLQSATSRKPEAVRAASLPAGAICPERIRDHSTSSCRRPKLADRKSTVRIGGASGFWGDSMLGAPQLVNSGQIDYLVFDYLAETTMAILAAAKAKRPEAGYATDFVDIVMKSVLPEVMRRGIKVVANAGGINPHSCARALRELAVQQGQ